MSIEWYPGHMAVARRQIAEVTAKIDVVIEVLDARLPISSANPQLQELRGHKPCIKILNKQDLADPAVTRAWVKHLEHEHGVKALPLEAKSRQAAMQVQKLCRKLVPHKGIPGRMLRAVVVGIPNVGKSTLINTLAGRKIARVGDKPAITTCPQQIDLRNHIFLSDTPGLLWPHLEDQTGAYRLAVVGTIGDNAFDYVDVAEFAAGFLAERYPERLQERYKLAALPESPREILETIGRKRGCLVAGGVVHMERAAELFLRELRGGLLGRISLEEPPVG